MAFIAFHSFDLNMGLLRFIFEIFASSFKGFFSVNLLLQVFIGKTDASAALYGENYITYRQNIAKQHAGKKRTAHKIETLTDREVLSLLCQKIPKWNVHVYSLKALVRAFKR